MILLKVNHGRIAHENVLFLSIVMMVREEEFNERLSQRANFKDCTPLHYAVLMEDFTIVKLLLDAGKRLQTFLPMKNSKTYIRVQCCHNNQLCVLCLQEQIPRLKM